MNQDRITVVIDAQKASAWAATLTSPLRENAARSQCTNNLQQIGLAMHNYHDRHKTFPPAYTVDKAGKPLLSWRVLILPYLDQEALYKEFHLDDPWDSVHNRRSSTGCLRPTIVPVAPPNAPTWARRPI